MNYILLTIVINWALNVGERKGFSTVGQGERRKSDIHWSSSLFWPIVIYGVRRWFIQSHWIQKLAYLGLSQTKVEKMILTAVFFFYTSPPKKRGMSKIMLWINFIFFFYFFFNNTHQCRFIIVCSLHILGSFWSQSIQQKL